MKKHLLLKFMLAVALCLPVALPTLSLVGCSGCTSSQQATAYKTLYTIEHTTVAAYDGYVSAVIKGTASTNGLPTVSKAFNHFQAGYLLALDAAQFNTNALAPASLVIESQDLLNAIKQFTGKK